MEFKFFLSIGTGLYGAAITFFLIDFLLKQKEKLDEEKIRRVTITSNVLSDFQSKEMLDCRIKSDKVFKDKLSITNLSDTSSLYYHLTEDLDCYDEWLSVSRLLHFWEHVAKLDKSELLDEELFKISLLPYLKGLYEGHDFKGFIDRSLNTHWADPVKELSKKYRVYL